jgi:hypothetical protein
MHTPAIDVTIQQRLGALDIGGDQFRLDHEYRRDHLFEIKALGMARPNGTRSA